jgi:hypothetical protein
MPKPNDPAVLSPPARYRGMAGVYRAADREAVDGLVALLAEAAALPAGTRVDVYGSLRRAVAIDEHGRRVGKPFNVWYVAEVDFTAAGGRSGSAVMRCEPAHVGLLAACEDYLAEFHTKPVRPPGRTTDLDDKADAAWRLRRLWSPPEVPDARA